MTTQDLKRPYSEAFVASSDPFVTPDTVIHQKMQKAFTYTPSTVRTLIKPLSRFDSNKENRPPPYYDYQATVEMANAPHHDMYQQQGLFSTCDLPHYSATDRSPIIYEDPVVAVRDDSIQPEGNPGTIDSKFQALSLTERSARSASRVPFQSIPHHFLQRTSLSVLHKEDFANCLGNINRNEVLIGFNKGKEFVKFDKYMLCSESRFFAAMLDGPFLSDSQTHYLRLRDDFPYGVKAMLEFIERGTYGLDPNMQVDFPCATLLDLHIHAYIVGNKYAVPRLCEHALSQYIQLSSMILNMHLSTDMNFNNAVLSGHSLGEEAPIMALDWFLDSLVLLWKNTFGGEDALRIAVLELIKPKLNKLVKVKFFVTLMMELVGFGDDVVNSLEEDGFRVSVLKAMGRGRSGALKVVMA